MSKILSAAQIIRSPWWWQRRAEAKRISFLKNNIYHSKDMSTNKMMRGLQQP